MQFVREERSKIEMRIVFMGTPDFAVGSLAALSESGKYEIVGVVTQPDRPKGRGNKVLMTPVKEYALEKGYPVYQPLKVETPEFVAELKAMEPDLIVVAAFGQILSKEVLDIPKPGVDADAVIIAAGPLVSDALAGKIEQLCGTSLHFFDAAAPIVSGDSIDMEYAFAASRYDHGDDDYINCPMNKEEYEAFYEALINAEGAPQHDFDKRKTGYEGCMPIEVLANRGIDTMRFGPMKPVGLRDPKTGHRPWACLQLRRETKDGEMFNLVGFQTNLKFGEQKRVFSMIPALHDAEFLRYGVMHRNTFINSPKLLGADYQYKTVPGLYFAGQITGVEGYMESAQSGIMAGINAARMINGEEPLILPKETMMGALSQYISDESVENFQPMGANFGVLPPIEPHIRDKKERYAALAQRSLDYFDKKD